MAGPAPLASGPALLASGRDADVFALDDRRVLRRYRRGGDVRAEAETMAYVAGLGFPTPAVYAAHGSDLVLERLHGPTMLGALIAGELDLSEGAGLLADLHRRLHDLPARHSPDEALGTGESAENPDPAARMLHLDLHPDNVMLSSRGPVVIDWRNAGEGRPDLDLALTALIMAQVAVDPAQPMAGAARELVAAFLARAGGDPLSMVDSAVARRRADPGLTAVERTRLDPAAALVRGT